MNNLKKICLVLYFAFFFTPSLTLAGSGVDTDAGGAGSRILRDHVDRFYEFQQGDITIDEFRSDSSEVDLRQMMDGINQDLVNPSRKQDLNWMNGQSQNDIDINVQELRSDGIREVTLDDGRVFSIEELENRLRMKVREQIRRK